MFLFGFFCPIFPLPCSQAGTQRLQGGARVRQDVPQVGGELCRAKDAVRDAILDQ